jgi:hypothetical protein
MTTMRLILALELTFWILVTYFIIRQVVVPLWKNEKMFPMFRTRRDLEVKLRDTRTAVGDFEVYQKIKEEAEKLPAPEAPQISTDPKIKSRGPVKTKKR